MSLIDFIEKLQNKPRHIRIRILWLSVLISMVIITSFWVISLKDSLSDKTEEKKSDELIQSLNKAKEQIPSLMDSFKASIGSFFEKNIEIENEEFIKEEIKTKQSILEEVDNKINSGKLPLSKNIND